MDTNIKVWYKSRTLWIAIAQAIIGVIAVFQTAYPDIQSIGFIAIVKSLLDLWIRSVTTTTLV